MPADGVAITAGSGTTILTDDTGAGGHAQVVKLAIATDGSGTLIPADATNGLLTDVKRVQGTVNVQNTAVAVYGGGTQTGTADQSVMAAAASNYNYLCWVSVYNSSATNTYAIIKDNATTRAVIPLPAFSGAIFQPPHPLKAAATNTAWNVAAGAGVTTAHFYGGGFQSTT